MDTFQNRRMEAKSVFTRSEEETEEVFMSHVAFFFMINSENEPELTAHLLRLEKFEAKTNSYVDCGSNAYYGIACLCPDYKPDSQQILNNF